MKVKLTELDFEGNGTVTGLKAPTQNTDVATKKYVDDGIQPIVNKVQWLTDTFFDDITTNSFIIKFDNLEGLTVTGIWDEKEQRIEC